jgi:hypothetical protein
VLALQYRAAAAAAGGDFERSRRLLEESLALARDASIGHGHLTYGTRIATSLTRAVLKARGPSWKWGQRRQGRKSVSSP